MPSATSTTHSRKFEFASTQLAGARAPSANALATQHDLAFNGSRDMARGFGGS